MGLGMTVEREILDLEGYVSQLKEEEGDDYDCENYNEWKSHQNDLCFILTALF